MSWIVRLEPAIRLRTVHVNPDEQYILQNDPTQHPSIHLQVVRRRQCPQCRAQAQLASMPSRNLPTQEVSAGGAKGRTLARRRGAHSPTLPGPAAPMR